MFGTASDQALPSISNNLVRHTDPIDEPDASQQSDLDGVPHSVELMASNTKESHQQASSPKEMIAPGSGADVHVRIPSISVVHAGIASISQAFGC